MASERHVVTGEVRLSYVHLLQAFTNKQDQPPKFSTTVLVPKSDVATMQRISAAIESAIQGGVELWKGRPPILALPVYDGDGVRPSDGTAFGQECRGCWVFTASTKESMPPRVVDANLQDIMDPRKVYSGVYGRVGVDFFPYNQNGKKGVGCGLTNVQILRDGEPLGNRTTAEDDFNGGQGGYAPPAPGYQQQRPAYGQAPQAPQPAYGQAPQPAPFAQAYPPGFAQPAQPTMQQAYPQPTLQQAYPQTAYPAQPYNQQPQQPAYGQPQGYGQPQNIDPLTGMAR